MMAILTHLPLTTMVVPFTVNAGTLTHFPLTLISILVSAIPWPSFAAMDDNAGLAIFMRG
ncbi:MAG: hypothetical protein AUI49_03870 [Candidatus Rokubacteria bacterium 13_1_40CM_2_68_13]|nr:MAG: hypothetical protein AUI49_03870 [Candidatus Rokubacteria bacterium 13_1_40CM_2_68_13]